MTRNQLRTLSNTGSKPFRGMIRILTYMVILFLLVSACDSHQVPEKVSVRTGAEMLIENHLADLAGKRVGLVMNPTARIGEVHVLDTLMALNVNVTALFAPEHGFRGEAGAGEIIEDGVDQATELPVFSLYGETRSPTPEMLQQTDLLLFDMQDVGARFYTYNSTLGLVLKEAAKMDIPVWVLDRPNPAGGDYVSGWIMEEEFESFVGMYPIPIAHGMTLGELARMMIGEKWLDADQSPQLRVIEMTGWNRTMKWPETGLEWIAPSPNLPTFEHAYAYLGTCLIEGTTLSEGRGTDDPFLTIGAPETNISNENLKKVNRMPGLRATSTSFTPLSIPGKAMNPKHEGELCKGYKLEITDLNTYDPVKSGLQLIRNLMNQTDGSEIKPYLYKLAGTKKIDDFLNSDMDEITFDFALDEFMKKRETYLIYH